METKGHVDVTTANSPYNLGTGDTYTAMAGDGGAVKVNSGASAYGVNLTFTSCTATTWSGGAIRNEGTVNLTGISIFTNNTSATAAAIWNHTGATFTMEGGTFSGNYATHSQGSGGIQNFGTFTATGDLYFSGNTGTGGCGSAIWNEGYAQFTMAGGTFTNNVGTVIHSDTDSNDTTKFTATGDLYFLNNQGLAFILMSGTGTMQNATFIGNTGGAICNQGLFTMENGVFTNNSVSSDWYDGGAILNDLGSTISMQSGTFTNNSAYFYPYSEEYDDTDLLGGGAIYNCGMSFDVSDFSMNDGIFTGNSTNAHGGAILNGGSFTATNALVFTANTAGRSGGAIYNVIGTDMDYYGMFSMAGGTFANNIAGGTVGGGAINNSGLFTATDVLTFTGNSAASNGGAVYNQDTFTMAGGTFSGNTAANGGAVYNAGSFTMADGTFSGNTTTTNGGAIYNTGSFTMAGGTFTGNTTAGTVGGAVYNTGSFTMADGTFTGNTTAGAGGAIYNTGSFTMADGVFTSNSSSGVDIYGGGAICNIGTFSMAGGTFTGNTGGKSGVWGGGAISNDGVFTATDTLYCSGNRTISGAGGAIFNGGSFTMAGGTFTNNRSTSGGAISNEGIFTATDTLYFSSNTGSELGGAIFNEGTFSMAGGTFANNVTNGGSGGGAFRNHRVFTATEDLLFSGNKTTGSSGGAIMMRKNVTMASGTFLNNTAAVQGGAIMVESGTFTATGDLYFSGNSAATSGGAVYNGGTITMAGGTFSGNTAADVGGAINNSGTFTATNELLFSGNSAGAGGGAISNTGSFTMAGGTFTGNISGSNGGAVLHTGGTFSMTGPVVFADNYAESSGGGAIRSDAFISATDTLIFTGNTAESYDGNGGALCSGGVFSMAGGTFANNVAYGSAGGGAIQTGNTFTATDTLFFTDNVAVNADGGAIWNDSTITMAGGTFTGNTAAGRGGAIYIKKGTVNATGDIEFSGNTAAEGGAVYNAGTFNFSKNLTLATDSDTLINASGATLNWNIAGGTADHAQLQGYKYLTNSGTLAITVAAESGAQQSGTYVIATEAVNSAAGTAFTLTGGTDTATITVGGGTVSYNGREYTLTQNTTDQTLVLNVKGIITTRTVVTTAMGPDAENAYDLGTGLTYTCPWSSPDGGAVLVDSGAYAKGSHLTFSGNASNYNGGAIRVNGTLTLSDTTFTSNRTTDDNGGAMIIDGTVSLSGYNLFENNYAPCNQGGGAIKVNSGVLNITGGTTVFRNNRQTRASRQYGGAGGGAILINSVLNADGDVIFEGNSSAARTTEAGAVSVGGAFNFSKNVTLVTSTDTLWVHYAYSRLNWNITGGTASYAKLNGFDKVINDGLLVITVDGANQEEGDYVIATGVEDTLAASKQTFTLCSGADTTGVSVTVDGGAVNYNGKSYSLAHDTEADTLTLSVAEAVSPVTSRLVVTATMGPDAENAYNLGSGITYSAPVWSSNGGAIQTEGDSFASGSDLLFTGNTSDYGGAIYNGGNLSLDGATFTGNTASATGGAVSVQGGTVNFTGAVTASNNAAQHGGAMENKGLISFSDTALFTGNSVTQCGGAIFNHGTGTVTLTGGTFANNIAGGTAGGAVYNGGTFTATGALTFSGNTVTANGGQGGAIYNSGTMQDSFCRICSCYWNEEKKQTDPFRSVLFNAEAGKNYRFAFPVRLTDIPQNAKEIYIIIQTTGHILLDNVEILPEADRAVQR